MITIMVINVAMVIITIVTKNGNIGQSSLAITMTIKSVSYDHDPQYIHDVVHEYIYIML